MENSFDKETAFLFKMLHSKKMTFSLKLLAKEAEFW